MMNSYLMVMRRVAALMFITIAATSAGGCVRGMTYKVPMPASMTIGTVKEDQTTLAAANSRNGTIGQRPHPIITSEARGPLSNR